MAHENLRELEDQLIELRQTYQEVISETREFEDPQLQNGPINAAEVRLSALRHEIAEVEKKIKKAESKNRIRKKRPFVHFAEGRFFYVDLEV